MGRPKTDFSHHCNKRSSKVALWGVSVTPESATYTYEGIHVFDILFGALECCNYFRSHILLLFKN